jgi:hypothetical protein
MLLSKSAGTLRRLAGTPMLMTDPTVRRWHEMLKHSGEAAMKVY